MVTTERMVEQGPQRQSQDSPFEVSTKDGHVEVAPAAKRPSAAKRTWDKLGLNIGILMMMFKGALPPTIAFAVYQNSAFAAIYSTLGYLVAIMSVLSFCILPRSKFIQTMLLNTVGICIGSAVALLQVYCSVQARAHTTVAPSPSSNGPSPGASVVSYNSSASAVSAIWLFFNIYLVNTLRASRPQLQFPVIMYSIFGNVAATYAPSFPTMTAGIAFVQKLITAFLTGFAIATGVSLFVFPTTVRMTFSKQSAGFITAVQGTLKAQIGYLQSLEREDVFTTPHATEDNVPGGKVPKSNKTKAAKPVSSLEAERLKAVIGALGELHGKMYVDLAFAKREMAWGKLTGSDIDELFKLLQGLMIPLTSLSSTADIFQRVAQRWGWTEPEDPSAEATPSEKGRSGTAKSQWNEIMRNLHDPFEAVTEAMNDGLQHVLYALEFGKPPKAKQNTSKANGDDDTSRDVEAEAGVVKPGDPSYAKYLAQRVDTFHEQRRGIITKTCQQRGVEVGTDSMDHLAQAASTFDLGRTDLSDDLERHQRNKRQLFVVLYMDFLLWSIGQAVLALVQFADKKVEDGTMKKKRLIVPGNRRIKKWFMGVLKVQDSTNDLTPDSTEGASAGISSGSSFGAAKDPEHLPPTNAWERTSDLFRVISRTLGSPESAFGFRVACATLSIGIVAYLENTRNFFLEQRLVWAMIMVAIGMTITAGSGVFGFIGRIAGTFIAMCTSLVIWYIVNGHPPGVIVFVFLFIFVETYFLLKYPRFIVIALLSIVTQVLILGYELEVRKVGVAVATSNGQPYYPVYELAPYRLACVSAGMFVAFFWTFFPYPLTARSQLRKDLGVSLYLLANFYSIVHTTVGLRIRGIEGDLGSKESPGRRLEKARRAVYVKELALLAGLRQHSAFTVWEPTFGGKFPRAQYDSIINGTQSILNYIALIAYASNSFSHDPAASPDKAAWIHDLSRLIGSINTTSQEITSILALLSAAVTNGNPLPPYLKPPQAYKLSARLEALDADILSISHIAEPGYSAFAVMQIASSLVSDDLRKLIANVKELVGEVDFSFHVISTADSPEESLEKGKQD